MTTDTGSPVLTAHRRDPRPDSEQASSGMDQSQPKAPNPEAEERPPAKPRNPAGKIALLVVPLFAGLTVWYAVTDLLAPYSARGSVSAYIAQIAPQVSGQVTEVFVQDNALVDQGAPLFALDRRPFEIAVRLAEAGLAQATQAINASSASLASSQAKVA
ncbi:biotin/lipoyl-binding protein [Microvirga arabica]|uniref:biotin/lipoyl-binding protein n=1 Tax=Microvirga arabica TaxID=1128671 RepID=UPI001939C227|nr:biotin/lipoyl-binding protein [Microvirga arabica]MBM1174792.1 biotin/lipoyl-binding protein [Microvirga arabica]